MKHIGNYIARTDQGERENESSQVIHTGRREEN